MRHHTGFAVPAGSAVYIHQAFLCCPYAGMNTSRIHDYVEKNGYHVVEDPAAAAVHVINTCGSDAKQAQLTYDAIKLVMQGRPDVPVVTTGCLNSIEPKRVAAALEGASQHAMLDTRNLDGLDELFQHDAIGFDAVNPSLRNRYSGTEFAEHGWYHVGVSTGCLGTCTFCAIRRATGRPRSTPIPSVLEDIDRGVAAGRADILFISTDLSAWGHDLGLTVVDLLRAIVAHPVEALYAAEAFEPTLFLEHFDALLPLLASGRFAWIAVPIQSGSQRILDAMQRPYAIDDVLAAIARLREAAPDLVIRTDILFGFGDETDDDFAASIAASRAFDIPSFNHYQERPGTAKVLLPDDVVIARRKLASEELYARAKGGPVRIRHLKAESTPFNDRVPEPDGYEAWRERQGALIGRVIANRAGFGLGEGWTVASARVENGELRSVVLEVSHRDGRAFDVALRHPEQDGNYLNVTDRFAIWVPGELTGDDERRALRRLERALVGRS
jgi:tRNA A37 methylthiotransferase MiaB